MAATATFPEMTPVREFVAPAAVPARQLSVKNLLDLLGRRYSLPDIETMGLELRGLQLHVEALPLSAAERGFFRNWITTSMGLWIGGEHGSARYHITIY